MKFHLGYNDLLPKGIPIMTREIVVGDVHGCVDELGILIDRLQLKHDDHLVFVGDLINKGPDSAGVIDLVQKIQRDVCKVTHLLGNHEEKFLRWVAHEEKRLVSAKENPILDRAGKLAKLSRELNDEQIQFLRCARLWSPLTLARDSRTNPAIAVHAGITPGLKKLPDENTEKSSMNAKQWREVESLVRVRRISGSGDRVRLGDEQATDRFWAEVYDGRYGTIFFGHEAILSNEVSRFPHAVGIDLGCVYGGHLAAVVFHQGGQPFEQVLVKAQATYHSKRSNSG